MSLVKKIILYVLGAFVVAGACQDSNSTLTDSSTTIEGISTTITVQSTSTSTTTIYPTLTTTMYYTETTKTVTGTSQMFTVGSVNSTSTVVVIGSVASTGGPLIFNPLTTDITPSSTANITSPTFIVPPLSTATCVSTASNEIIFDCGTANITTTRSITAITSPAEHTTVTTTSSADSAGYSGAVVSTLGAGGGAGIVRPVALVGFVDVFVVPVMGAVLLALDVFG